MCNSLQCLYNSLISFDLVCLNIAVLLLNRCHSATVIKQLDGLSEQKSLVQRLAVANSVNVGTVTHQR
jgi:hypothetical protein